MTWDGMEYVDDDPIVSAMWVPVLRALKEERLPTQRKALLQKSLQLLPKEKPSTFIPRRRISKEL